MKKKAFSNRILMLILLILALLLFGVGESYLRLTVDYFTISEEQIENKIRIVTIADLHGSTFGAENANLVKKIQEQEPNLIFLDGDMLNENADSHGHVTELVSHLRDICPVYYSMGNHEKNYDDTHAEFWTDVENAGAIVLDKKYVDVEVNGVSLRIGGLYDYAFALDGNDSVIPEHMDQEVYGFLDEFRDTDAYKIMLAHRPDSFIFASDPDVWEVDLVVSGHVHGGQVILPVKGGLWAPDQGYFPKYTSGQYELGTTTMLITRGLGSDVQKLPRFNNPPEIMVIDLE